MKIHHLNCATFCPPLVSKRINGPGKLVCHCLLIESAGGLTLVDTGLGAQVFSEPGRRSPPGMLTLLGARFNPAETALSQIQRLGFHKEDVRHILLTHLDFDHAGGIVDFPEAEIHLFEDEYQAATTSTNIFEKQRYRPALWEHGPRWRRYRLPGSGERWFGFESVRAIPGSSDEILLIPVVGHTRGHCAIAVKTDSDWLLHCGDAYFYAGEMDPAGRRCTRILDVFQRVAQVDGRSRMRNQERLRMLNSEHGSEIRMFCAHDPEELARYSRM